MTEPIESSPLKMEKREGLAPARAASVDMAGYLESYSLYRHDSDRPHDRIPEINRIAESHPVFSDRIMLLDAQIERALQLEEDISPRRISPITLDPPPDYNFSGVRSVTARRLLDLLNLSHLNESSIINPAYRSESLRINGKKLKDAFTAGDSQAIVRATTVGVVEAVLSGKIEIDAPPKLPHEISQPEDK